MSSFNITRRIDELGRIVIPKEMRNELGIRDGELLEISLQSKELIIKKYSKMEKIKKVSENIVNVITSIKKLDIIITDREKVVTTSDSLKELDNKELNEELKRLIDNRESKKSEIKINIFGLEKYVVILPIINESDCSGLVIMLSDKLINNIEEVKIIKELIEKSITMT